jgi:nucleotidyltransferase substrate binding protein (TIGR01987 family)
MEPTASLKTGDEDIRWKQRFSNYEKALGHLNNIVEHTRGKDLEDMEKLALIKAFELTFELAWNVMKDYLQNMGVTGIIGSKGAIRQAFSDGLISNGQLWMEMVAERNETAHAYDQAVADTLAGRINRDFYPEFLSFKQKMDSLS